LKSSSNKPETNDAYQANDEQQVPIMVANDDLQQNLVDVVGEVEEVQVSLLNQNDIEEDEDMELISDAEEEEELLDQDIEEEEQLEEEENDNDEAYEESNSDQIKLFGHSFFCIFSSIRILTCLDSFSFVLL